MKDPLKPLRARLFRFLLLCLEKRRPQVFDCLVIRILMNTTAAAFRTDPVPVPVRPGGAAKALGIYASFTKHCMEGPHLMQPADRGRLFHYSLVLGRKCARSQVLRTDAICSALCFCSTGASGSA